MAFALFYIGVVLLFLFCLEFDPYTPTGQSTGECELKAFLFVLAFNDYQLALPIMHVYIK